MAKTSIKFYLLPLPKHSLTITETISLKLNLNPSLKNPNPLWKNLNPSRKNPNPSGKVPYRSRKNLPLPPWNFSTTPAYRNFSVLPPPQKFFTPLPPKFFWPPLPQKKFSTPPPPRKYVNRYSPHPFFIFSLFLHFSKKSKNLGVWNSKLNTPLTTVWHVLIVIILNKIKSCNKRQAGYTPWE